MSIVDVRLAIDRLKVNLAMSVLDEGVEKDEMRHKLVSLQMRLRKLRDEEEEEEVGAGLGGWAGLMCCFAGSAHQQCWERDLWA